LVAGEGRIGLFGVGVDAAAEGAGVLEAVADEVGARVEGAVAGVVVKDDEAVLGFAREDGLEEIVAEKLGTGEDDGLVLFAGAEVEEAGGGYPGEGGGEVGRFDEKAPIVLVGLKDVADDFVNGQIFVTGADFGEGLGVVVGAAFAAADVVAGEKGAFRPGKTGEDIPHGGGAIKGGSFGGGDHDPQYDPIPPPWHLKFELCPGAGTVGAMKRHIPGPWSNPQVYLLPNLMTAGNLACGFSAVMAIFDGMQSAEGGAREFHIAIFLILGACLFDALDGRIARLKGQDSMFGREFDSLADIISFGIAPALLVMDMVLKSFDDRLGWTIAFVYLLCGAMRLARFNCLSQAAAEDKTEPKSRDFVGFPIPAAAGLIASLTLFMLWLNEGDKNVGNWKYLLVVIMPLLSFMMLSEFSYPSFKAMNWKAKKSLVWLFVAILVLVCAVNFVEFVPLLIFMSYLTYGLVRPWISREWRREIEDGVDENGDEAEALIAEDVKDANEEAGQ